MRSDKTIHRRGADRTRRKPYRFPEDFRERLAADNDVRAFLERAGLPLDYVVGFCRLHLRQGLSQWEMQRYAGKVAQAGARPLGASAEMGDLKVAVCSKRRLEYRDGTAKELNSFDGCQEQPADTFVPSVDSILNLANGLASFVRFVGMARGMKMKQIDSLVLPLQKWLDTTSSKLDSAPIWVRRLGEDLPLRLAEEMSARCPKARREDCLYVAGRIAELADLDEAESGGSRKTTVVARLKKRKTRRRDLALKWRQEREAEEKRRQARHDGLMAAAIAGGRDPAGGQKVPKKT